MKSSLPSVYTGKAGTAVSVGQTSLHSVKRPTCSAYALLAFVAIDYITGIMCAVVDKKLSSEVGFKGIFKKVLTFALVGIGHILDTRVIGSGSVMRTAVIFFYLSNEGVSLLENAAYLGLPIPQKLKSVLEQLHDRAEKEDE